MVKLDAAFLRYLSSEDFRVLTAVEMGLKNHELVPATLVSSIAALSGGGVSKILHSLTRNKLLVYERGKKFDGYRLTFLGYDYLALNVLSKRGIITKIGNQIGVGKESDVFCVANDDDERFALKIHRLGRTCFRKVNDKRDYHHKNRKLHNWIYMSRLAAVREFAFMKALHDRGFPSPKPIDNNRHCVVMELVNGNILNNLLLEQINDVASLYDKLIDLILTLANEFGLVHGDFNEFNIMIDKETHNPILIDFPQMISTSHKMAEEYFTRDVECIVNLFNKRYHYASEEIPVFERDVEVCAKEEIRSIAEDTNFLTKMDACRKYLENIDNEINEIDNEFDNEFTINESVTLETSNFNSNLQNVKSNESEINGPSNFNERKIIKDEYCEIKSELSNRTTGTYSVPGSTFSCEYIRAKLKKEVTNKTKREELKKAVKNVKGEDCAIRRQRRANVERIKEDIAFVELDGI